jgi:hypothetical protein
MRLEVGLSLAPGDSPPPSAQGFLAALVFRIVSLAHPAAAPPAKHHDERDDNRRDSKDGLNGGHASTVSWRDSMALPSPR